MKEKLLALLVLKFKGVSNAILEKIAEKKAEGLTEESQLQNIVDGVEFGDILTSEADRRATLATQTAIENYEKQYGLKAGKPVQQDPPVPPTPPTPPVPPKEGEKSELEKIIEAQAKQISDLTNLVSGVVTGQQLANRKAAARLVWDKNEIKLPEKWFETRLKFDSDTSFEDQIKALGEEYVELRQGVVDESIASGSLIPQTFKTEEMKQEELTKLFNGDSSSGEDHGVKLDI